MFPTVRTLTRGTLQAVRHARRVVMERGIGVEGRNVAVRRTPRFVESEFEGQGRLSRIPKPSAWYLYFRRVTM